jgi:hypothetical protein
MKNILFLVFFALLVASCSQQKEQNETTDLADTTVTWLDHLNRIDSALLADETMNPDKGWEAFGAFRSFARANPDHPLAPTYHMKAAAIARNIPGKALMAIKEYNEVYTKYPKDTLAPQAQFLVGFTFDQALADAERARKAYVKFIEDWPQHPLAAQARDLVALIDHSGSEIDQVKAWEKKNKE